MHVDQSSPVALLVEDEPLISMDTADMLEEQGYQVLERATADAALTHMVTYDQIDLLVTDVYTPGKLSGLNLAHEVARQWPEVAIVIVSAVAQVEPKDLPQGAVFIRKPLTRRNLRQALQRFG